MKVFVPVYDELLETRAAEAGRLVPFDPEFLAANSSEGRKPNNWIVESDYRAACKRLWESQEQELYQA